MLLFSVGIPVNIVTTPLDCLDLCSPLGHTETAECSIGPVALGAAFSNTCDIFCAAIAVSQTDIFALTGTVISSIPNQKNPFEMPLPKYVR